MFTHQVLLHFKSPIVRYFLLNLEYKALETFTNRMTSACLEQTKMCSARAGSLCKMQNSAFRANPAHNIFASEKAIHMTTRNDWDEGRKDQRPQGLTDTESEERSTLFREDIKLPEFYKRRKVAFVLYNVFTKKECDELIAMSEKAGYVEALVNIGGGKQLMMKDVRNSSRCVIDSAEKASLIWNRIKQYIPEIWIGREVVGLNERLRFLRYSADEYFLPHMDGTFKRDNGERSYFTVQLYLNEGFQGGNTIFMDHNKREKQAVVPKTGMVLVFQHDLMHEGEKLVSGRKYNIRTEVMYSPKLETK